MSRARLSRIQAVILAGGKGSRLGPLTLNEPKVMLKVDSKPFLEYQILYLKKFGIQKIVLTVGYLWEQIQSYFKDGAQWGVSIQYAVEQTLKGTAGALLNASRLLEENFFLLYGDSFLPCNYHNLLSEFEKSEVPILMTVYDNKMKTYVENNVALDDGHYVVLYEKDRCDKRLSFVDAGVLLFKKEILKQLPVKEEIGLEEDLYPKLANKRQLRAYLSPKRFYDIGTIERLEQARSAFHDYFQDAFPH